MNKRVIVLICGLSAAFAGCGEDPGLVQTRIRFLMEQNKPQQALDEGLKRVQDVRMSHRGEVLLDLAKVAITLYRSGGQKSNGIKALEMMREVIDNKLILDGRPYMTASEVFEIDHQYDKAVEYMERAEGLFPSDPYQAGLCRYNIIRIYRDTSYNDGVLKHAKIFREKYSSHDRMQDVERWESEAMHYLEKGE